MNAKVSISKRAGASFPVRRMNLILYPNIGWVVMQA